MAQSGQHQFQAGQFQQREQNDYNRSLGVAGYLQGQVQGTGPSVAGAMLGAGQDQAARTQMAGVAGGTGTSAALNSYGALQNTALAQTQAAQQAAILKQQEQQAAIQQLAQLYAVLGNRSMGMANINTGAGLDYARLGYGVQGQNVQTDLATQGALLQGLGAGVGYLTSRPPGQ